MEGEICCEAYTPVAPPVISLPTATQATDTTHTPHTPHVCVHVCVHVCM